MRTKHPTDESEENSIKRSKENDRFCYVICNICGQVFGSQKHRDSQDHEKHGHCMYCFKLFSTPRELETRIREMHSFT